MRSFTLEPLPPETMPQAERVPRKTWDRAPKPIYMLAKLDAKSAEIIAYAKRHAPHVAPAVHQVLRAKPDDCYQSCGRKAEPGSSRCAPCAAARMR